LNFSKFILSVNGFPVSKAEKELSFVQSLPIDAFKDWQQKKAWSIARFHFDNNAFYKLKVGNTFPDNWEDLPVLTKLDLQQPLASLLTRGVKLSNCYTAYTSGSSGNPFYFAKDAYAHAMTWAMIANRYSWHKLGIDDKQARFSVMPVEAKKHWRETIKDRLMNRVRCNVLDLSEPALEEYLQLFRRHPFAYIYGYTSALSLFARYLEKKDIVLKDVCPSLRLCTSTSELSTEWHTELFQRVFGVKHIREYGASETCITGFDDVHGQFLLTEETLYNEVVDGDKQPLGFDKAGTLLSTSLYNTAMPIVRYQLGDELTLTDNKGSIYRTISQFCGRTNDVIQLPGGKQLAAMALDHLVGSTLKTITVIKEFIVRQTAIDNFIFEVVAERKLNETELALLKEKTVLYLHQDLKIDLKYMEQINRPASGKLKLFYSELS
jgi:phenylacetate-CoA ligase